MTLRRVYDEPAPDGGPRVLVDKLWPRGMTNHHDPALFAEFGHRYRLELQEPAQAEALAHLRELAKAGPLTLLTATRRPEISEAAVLVELLCERGAVEHV